MVPLSLSSENRAPASRATHVYGSLILVVLASELLGFLLAGGVAAVDARVPDALDPQLAGAVVYAALGLVALGVGLVAVRRLRRSAGERLEGHDVVQLGGVAAMLLLVFGYVLHGAADLPVFPGDVVSALLNGGVAMGVLGFLYASAWEVDVRLAVPDRDALPLAGATVLACAVTVIGQYAVLAATGDLARNAALAWEFGPRLSAGRFIWSVLLPGAFVGVGTAVLYNAAIQEVLRDYVGPAEAVAAVTALAGAIAWATTLMGLAASPVGSAAALASTVVLSVLAALLAARGVRFVTRTGAVTRTPVVAGAFGVFVLAFPLAGVAAFQSLAAGFVVTGVASAVVAGVAGVAYERSRSVWLPALAFTSHQVLGNYDLVLTVMGFLG